MKSYKSRLLFFQEAFFNLSFCINFTIVLVLVIDEIYNLFDLDTRSTLGFVFIIVFLQCFGLGLILMVVNLLPQLFLLLSRL